MEGALYFGSLRPGRAEGSLDVATELLQLDLDAELRYLV